MQAASRDAIILPAESQKSAQAVPDGLLGVIARMGHLVAIEQPDAINRTVTEWLNRHGFVMQNRAATSGNQMRQ